MKCYKCEIGDYYMYEDELPDDLPQDVYNWWYENSHVNGVRMGPIIEEVTSQSKSKAKQASKCIIISGEE